MSERRDKAALGRVLGILSIVCFWFDIIVLLRFLCRSKIKIEIEIEIKIKIKIKNWANGDKC